MIRKANRIGLADHLRNHAHPGGIIVCERLKFIYMKPTKTAGTSILRSTLQKQVPGIFHHKDQPEAFKEWLNRITDAELEEYFIFSVVRNPWDRLVSVAAYFKIPFKDFVLNMDEYCKDEGIRIHSLPLTPYTHLNGKQFVDHICRFESLQADMNLVCDNIGIARSTLPHTNKSKHQHYSTYYGPEEIDAVRRIYGSDIEKYGYSFSTEANAARLSMSSLKENWFKLRSRFI